MAQTEVGALTIMVFEVLSKRRRARRTQVNVL